MPTTNLQRAGVVLDWFLRPDHAARNAQQAAADAAHNLEARRVLEVELADLAAADRDLANRAGRRFG